MPVSYTVNDRLLPDVKRRFGLIMNVPNGGIYDTDVLRQATDIMHTTMVNILLEIKEEHLVVTKKFTIQAGAKSLVLPDTALADRLRLVRYSPNNDDRFIPLERTEPERAHDVVPGFSYFFRDSMIIFPRPFSTTVTLEVSYYFRPPELCLNTDTRITTVSAVDTIGTDYRLTLTAARFGTTNGATVQVNVISPRLPFKCALSVTGTLSNSGLYLTLPANDVLYPPSVGMFACPTDVSPVPLIPSELYSVLAQKVVVDLLEAYQKYDKVAPAIQVYDRLLKEARNILAPRSDGNPRYVVNRNGPGWSYYNGDKYL